MKCKCNICNNEYNASVFKSHVKKYHQNLSDIELAKLNLSNNPKLYKLGNEFIDFAYKNKYIDNFIDCAKFVTLETRGFNAFLQLLEKFKDLTTEDIDTYFNYFKPYKKQHPKDVNSVELANIMCRNDKELGRKFYESVLMKRNAFTGHDGSLSPWSTDFVGYKDLSASEKIKVKRQKCYCKDRDDFKELEKNVNTSIEYYLNKGYSENEAKDLLTERQRTFSLKKCVEKFGEEEGTKRFKERQEKWLKNFKKKGYSKISQDLFWKILNEIKINCLFATNNNGVYDDKHIHEKVVETKTSYVKLDFYIPELNKWIEFDGDYWHGEKRGNQKRDKEREEAIFNAMPNISLKRVKERDFKKDPEAVLKECVEWILN